MGGRGVSVLSTGLKRLHSAQGPSSGHSKPPRQAHSGLTPAETPWAPPDLQSPMRSLQGLVSGRQGWAAQGRPVEDG